MFQKYKNNYINNDEIQWLTLTKVHSIDRIGRVFTYKGNIFRAIHPGMESFVLSLFEKKIIQKLISTRVLLDTKVTRMRLNNSRLILWHEKIEHVTKPAFWPWEFYKSAGITFLKLNEQLLDWGLATCDGHQENIMMRQNCSPVFIDFGSLLPLNESRNGLTSLEQFKRCFFNIMMLRLKKPELETIIRMICYQKGSLKDEEYLAMTGESIEIPFGNRSACLRLFKAIVSKLEFANKHGTWSGYHKDKDFSATDPNESDDTRAELINNLLKLYRPSTVIDIASNAGKFAMMAAQHGAKVYAFDIDPEAIDRLYYRAIKAGPGISLSVGIHNIFRGDRYDFRRRPLNATGEVALSLAISHHMFITQKMPMTFIAHILSAYSQKILISEFMPYGLGSTKYQPHPLPKGYDMMNYINAFKGIFRRVKIIYYPTLSHWSFRVLLVFEDKLDDQNSIQDIEKIFVVCRTNKFATNGFILRIICNECKHIFIVDKKEFIACPNCKCKTPYHEVENIFDLENNKL